jgi:hypothetical protein
VKRGSEAVLGAALRGLDLEVFVYKPPDGVNTNLKPCDFFVWTSGDDAWFEAKDTDSVNVFSFREVRPSQWNGIRDAKRLGIPYWVAVYWRRHRHWTISRGADLLALKDAGATSVTRELLMSRHGVDSTPAMLESTLKSVMLDEI